MRHLSFAARGSLYLLLLGSLLGCAGVATPIARQPPPQQQQAKPAAQQQPDTSIDRPTSEPYKGDLSIFEDPQRARNLQIDRVMDLLKMGEGSRVADIGAGSGWFTVRAARRVGAGGRVYAVEINRDYLRHIEKRAKREGLTNIETVLGTEDDPRLPAGGVDAVLILKTYHEIAEPVRLLQHLKKSLGAAGLVGVIDRNGQGDDHGLNAAKVIEEAGRAGFELTEQYDFVKPDGMDYFLIFKVKSEK